MSKFYSAIPGDELHDSLLRQDVSLSSLKIGRLICFPPDQREDPTKQVLVDLKGAPVVSLELGN